MVIIKHSSFGGWQSNPLVLLHTETDLGNKDQTERDGAAKDDHQCHNAELDIGLVSCQKRHSSPDDAHDAHVVNTHADVFAVVEGRDAHVPGLPCQETAEQLSGLKKNNNKILKKKVDL